MIKNRRGGFYWFNKKPYVSATTVLKVIDKPALRYWVGREVYRAMIVDPTMSEKEALGAPYKKKKKAGQRGTTVHSIVESWKKTEKKITLLPDDIKPYANAFYKFVEDNKLELLEHEKTVVSKKHHYAGTLDIIAKKNGDIWILDVKTGKDIYTEAHIQVSAYKNAAEENGQEIDRMGVVLLQENGNYKFEETEDVFDVFIATKLLWEFLNKELCEKVGYEG
jgi:genome maintenance exonuclease 1